MKKECSIIRELLPSYIENLCSEDVNEYVKEHLSECEECRSIYKLMNEGNTLNNEIIEETKPFLKIKRKNKKNIIIASIISILFVLIFGTRITSEFTKFRFNQYLNKNYPEYNLEISNFSYVDYESMGFGINNGGYIAEVYDTDEKENPDINFNIHTEGFFLKIKDNYKYRIEEEKETTKERIENEYANDINKILFENGKVKSVNVSVIGDYKKDLKLNMPYSKNINKDLKLNLYIQIYEEKYEPKAIAKTIDNINKELIKEGVNPYNYDFNIYNGIDEQVNIEKINSNYKDINELEKIIKEKM